MKQTKLFEGGGFDFEEREQRRHRTEWHCNGDCLNCEKVQRLLFGGSKRTLQDFGVQGGEDDDIFFRSLRAFFRERKQ